MDDKILDKAFDMALQLCPATVGTDDAIDYLITAMNGYAKEKSLEFTEDDIKNTISRNIHKLEESEIDFKVPDWTMPR